MDRAACKGAPLGWFLTPDGQPEPSEPDPRAAALCWVACGVREQCLAWAQHFGEQGTWGGLSSWQRAQLKRKRSRLACPVCGSRQVAHPDGRARAWRPARAPRTGGGAVVLEVCLACAVSWRAA